MSIEAMKLALEALEDNLDTVRQIYETDWRHGLPTRKTQLDGMKQELNNYEAAITSLRQAIEQAQMQEPVAWDGKCVLGHCGSPSGCEDSHCCRADYTTPPQRQPLTDEQVREIARQYALGLAFPYDSKTTPEMFARAIEAAHGIKGEAC